MLTSTRSKMNKIAYTEFSSVKKGDSLLKLALNHAQNQGFSIENRREITDRHGLIGYLLLEGILLAREYIWGGIVSIHEKILKYAEENGDDILLYISRERKIFRLTPETIRWNALDVPENYRGGQLMVNFRLKSERNSFV